MTVLCDEVPAPFSMDLTGMLAPHNPVTPSLTLFSPQHYPPPAEPGPVLDTLSSYVGTQITDTSWAKASHPSVLQNNCSGCVGAHEREKTQS